jgi:hypothetical protein
LAKYQAIAAVSATLRGVLADSVIPEIAGAEFQVVNADTLQSPMADGVAVFLYHVAANAAPLNGPPRSDPGLVLELHYLVTAWAADPIRQQVLLGWAARVLEAVPILSASVLNQHAPATGVFQAAESIRLTAGSLSLQDEASIWGAAKVLPQPSIHYVATGVRLDPSVAP